MRSDTDRNKKRLGALLSALSVGGFMVIVAVCMLVDYFGSGGTAAETLIIVICALLYLAMAGGVFLALRQRWRELERGEEEEARKY